MTADEFREMAVSFAGASEGSHMNHPDFRAHGRIFATLGYPDGDTGMVKLPMQEQQRLVQSHPHTFYPAKGAWGLQGSTMIHLKAATADVISEALALAWHESAAKPPNKTTKKQIQQS